MRHLIRLFVVGALLVSLGGRSLAGGTTISGIPSPTVGAPLLVGLAPSAPAANVDDELLLVAQADTRQPDATVKAAPKLPPQPDPRSDAELTKSPAPAPAKKSDSSWIPVVIGLLLLLGLVFLFGSALARKRRQISAEIEDEKAAAVEAIRRERLAEKAEEPREPLPTEEQERLPLELVEEEPAREKRKPAIEPQEPAATIADGLAKTQKEGFIARLGNLFKGKVIDESLLDELEEVLFTADIGVKTAQHLLETVREKLSKKELKNAEMVWATLKSETLEILKGSSGKPVSWAEKPPHVIMVVGVNGTGKTTTIGKLANHFSRKGTKVLLAAGDTFRAAAVEQLSIWGERVDVPVHKGKTKADPASVIFDAVQRGLDDQFELVIADTAGRLHTAANLMEELKKIRRVVQKIVPDAPHEVLLVLDATMGQNSIQQANQFKAAMDVTGIVLTKLDGTAKGGVIIAISKEMGIPIRYVGVGEKVQDLQPFDPQEFVDALFVPLPD